MLRRVCHPEIPELSMKLIGILNTACSMATMPAEAAAAAAAALQSSCLASLSAGVHACCSWPRCSPFEPLGTQQAAVCNVKCACAAPEHRTTHASCFWTLSVLGVFSGVQGHPQCLRGWWNPLPRLKALAARPSMSLWRLQPAPRPVLRPRPLSRYRPLSEAAPCTHMYRWRDLAHSIYLCVHGMLLVWVCRAC